MTERPVEKCTITKVGQNEYLPIWIEKFLIDRKIEGYARGTLYFYEKKLALLSQFCEGQAITSLSQIDSDTIRNLLLWLESTGHNPGGRHAVYRATKTLIRWWISETEPEGYKDPFKKVKAPKLSKEVLDPVGIDAVKRLISVCRTDRFTGARDKAIFLFLIDTGVRAFELLGIQVAEADLTLGVVLVRKGKFGKSRSVFIGKTTRRAIRGYLKFRTDSNPALWVSDEREALSYSGLHDMLVRRSGQARIKTPQLHGFRRAFALGMLRGGVDVYTLQKLMGHADLQVLRRYLAQTDADLAAAHRRAGLGDNL